MKTLQELQDALADDFLDPDMPEKLVDAELRSVGLDPDDVAARGVAFVEGLRRQQPESFLAGLSEDFEALRADPKAWADELRERDETGL